MDEILEFAFLVIGPCAIVYSFVSFFRTQAFLRTSVEVTGEVIRLEHSTDGLGTTSYESYAPVFTFTAADGTRHTVTSNISSSPADFSIGDSVRVRYEPANPQDARIHSVFQTWGAAIISGVVGVGFVAFGCDKLGLLHLTK